MEKCLASNCTNPREEGYIYCTFYANEIFGRRRVRFVKEGKMGILPFALSIIKEELSYTTKEIFSDFGISLEKTDFRISKEDDDNYSIIAKIKINWE